jgi:hypothetical protein
MMTLRLDPRRGWLAFAVLAALFPATARAQTGGLRGTVTTSTGTPLPKAFIVATNKKSNYNTRSGADGSFTLSGLAAGTYRVCVQALDGSLLDPCQWSATPTSVTVSSGQTTAVGTIQVLAGQRLYVNLQDVAGVLAVYGNGQKPGAHVLVGVWSASGLFHPFRLRSKNSGMWSLDLVVPFATPLNITVSSADFALTDNQGKKVNANTGAGVSIQVESGTNPAPIIFNVTGLNGH